MNKTSEIPKIIHYCWFGKKEKSQFIKKCIRSWEKNLANYEIIEWNETNFDIRSNNFVKEAYEIGKYAFVSDYVRAMVLYNYGGIYLDTDVEILKSLDVFLQHQCFWGFEERNFIATSTIGAVKGNKLMKKLLDSYEGKSFILPNGDYNTLTNVAIVTKLFEDIGIKLNGKYQELDDFGVVYPQTYFSPYDYINCRSRITDNSYTIHYFYKSWVPFTDRFKSNIKKLLAGFVGGDTIAKLRGLDK